MGIKELIRTELQELFKGCEGNRIPEEGALKGCAGLEIYDSPLIGFADAADPLFEEFKKKEIIGEPYRSPKEWLPGAETVISIFLPYTEQVRKSNRGNPERTSNGWLHARVEGHELLNAYIKKVVGYFKDKSLDCIAPLLDPGFKVQFHEGTHHGAEGISAASSWSERHAAYVCGLGTFSLTRSLITKKGAAGRYGSVIIGAKYDPDERTYTGLYDHCIRCGACISRCPVNAISLERGKNQKKCFEWVEKHTKVEFAPRYGCGKCQTGVPCEAGIP
ncbi:MAG: 4Fe-4S binding protein [Lachnospiraceae bacterium]|nr:4Fe-4S binding protein [Lachnospiraceae bacterium]